MTQILVPLLFWAFGELALRRVSRANNGEKTKVRMYAEESFGGASLRASAVLTPWFLRIGIIVFIAITSTDNAQDDTVRLIVFGSFLLSFAIAQYLLRKRFESEEDK